MSETIIKTLSGTVDYTYDEAGQLKSAYYSNGVKYNYTYDVSGNIVCREEYSVEVDNSETLVEKITYVYDGNVLVYSQSTIDGETEYTNDNMGNPIAIQKGDITYAFTWGEGRMLKGINKDNDNNVSYTYNVDGLRVQKVVKENGVSTVTEYVWGNNGLAGLKKDGDTVVVYYDENGQSVGFSLNDTIYHYVKNLQGDVVRILDENANTVVEYRYDSWGVPTVTGDTALAEINPCSYRGYDYDEETGYYYLQSRYYDPEVGRFISAEPNVAVGIFDNEAGLHGYNIYSYCANNPILYKDVNGESISLATCIVIGVIVGGITGAVASKMYYGKVNGWWVLSGAALGGVIGYVGGAFFGASGIKAGTLAAKIKMSKVRWLGKIGEKMSTWTKNTEHIRSYSGTAKYRIPGYLNKTEKVIGEVKNVKELSYTNQLKDYMLYAEDKGYTFILKIRRDTKLSSTLKTLVDNGKIVILYLN